MSGIVDASAEFQDLISSLLQVNENKRLGAKNGAQEIMEHPFFHSINWERVGSLDLKPPFKPKVTSANDVGNFDKTFIEQAPVDSFVHSKID